MSLVCGRARFFLFLPERAAAAGASGAPAGAVANTAQPSRLPSTNKCNNWTFLARCAAIVRGQCRGVAVLAIHRT